MAEPTFHPQEISAPARKCGVNLVAHHFKRLEGRKLGQQHVLIVFVEGYMRAYRRCSQRKIVEAFLATIRADTK